MRLYGMVSPAFKSGVFLFTEICRKITLQVKIAGEVKRMVSPHSNVQAIILF